MCCMILCSNGVFDATCHKHIFCDSLSHFLCSLTQGFGNFLVLQVSFCSNYNRWGNPDQNVVAQTTFCWWMCGFAWWTTIVLQLRSTESTNASSVFLSFSFWSVWWEKWAIPATNWEKRGHCYRNHDELFRRQAELRYGQFWLANTETQLSLERIIKTRKNKRIKKLVMWTVRRF